MNVNPIAIILVFSDSKGYRLLYRYPYRVLGNEKFNPNQGNGVNAPGTTGTNTNLNTNNNNNGVNANGGSAENTSSSSSNLLNISNSSSNNSSSNSNLSMTDNGNDQKSSHNSSGNSSNNGSNNGNVSTVTGSTTAATRSHQPLGGIRKSVPSNSCDSLLNNSSTTSTTSSKRPPHRFPMQSVDDLLQPTAPSATLLSSNIVVIKSGQLHSFADDLLAPLFAVKPQLCNQKFELKINEVRFVSHPTLVQRREQHHQHPANVNNNVNSVSQNTFVGPSSTTITTSSVSTVAITAATTPTSATSTTLITTLTTMSSTLSATALSTASESAMSSSSTTTCSTINSNTNLEAATTTTSTITSTSTSTSTTIQATPHQNHPKISSNNNNNNNNNNVQNPNVNKKSCATQGKNSVNNNSDSSGKTNTNNQSANDSSSINEDLNVNTTNLITSGGCNNSNATATTATTTSPTTTVSSTMAGNASQNQRPQPQQMLINIVFALHVQASYSIVKCYYDLSKRLGLALKVEEQRVGYINSETLDMIRTHDEIASHQQPLERAYDMISEHSTLAQSLKSIYHDLCSVGILNTTINQNLTLSFCLPAKAHQLLKKGSLVDPETIENCLKSLKPYHGILLLVDFVELLDCIPPSGARMLLQLIDVYTPLMSLQSMASDADLSIEHVYKLVSHLVHWAKATIIYPLCETNVYVIAPDAPLHTKSHLVEKFAIRFPGMSLFEVISDFSLPTSIGHLTTPLQQSARQGILAQMVLWMLQRHLLVQLHTYVQFMPSNDDFDSDLEPTNIYSCGVALDQYQHTDQQQQQLENENSRSGRERSTHTDDDDEYRGMEDDRILRMDVHVQRKDQIMDNDSENGIVHNSTEQEHNDSQSMTDFIDSVNVSNEDLSLINQSTTHLSKDNLSIFRESGSMLSLSSHPLPVPNSSYRTMMETEDRLMYSGVSSTTSDNLPAQPSSSSHKSNFSVTTSISTDNDNCDSIASIEEEERIKDLLQVFNESDRLAIKRIPASANVDDLTLMVKLYQAGYFRSEHHLEEIMYFENLRRSQLLQLLDKFRDVLIIYETEDPAITSMYRHKLSNDS